MLKNAICFYVVQSDIVCPFFLRRRTSFSRSSSPASFSRRNCFCSIVSNCLALDGFLLLDWIALEACDCVETLGAWL